jgi:GNAT superfamily N-acetyltransferase
MPLLRTSPSRTQYELTDDRSRLDLTQLLSLYQATWWAQGREERDVERALEHSHPVITAWDGPELVGFTRVISDRTYRATIWDVIVRESHRGRSLGSALVQYVLDHPDLKSVSYFLLLTKDQHAFYERLGFEREQEMAMMLRR